MVYTFTLNRQGQKNSPETSNGFSQSIIFSVNATIVSFTITNSALCHKMRSAYNMGYSLKLLFVCRYPNYKLITDTKLMISIKNYNTVIKTPPQIINGTETLVSIII